MLTTSLILCPVLLVCPLSRSRLPAVPAAAGALALVAQAAGGGPRPRAQGAGSPRPRTPLRGAAGGRRGAGAVHLHAPGPRLAPLVSSSLPGCVAHYRNGVCRSTAFPQRIVHKLQLGLPGQASVARTVSEVSESIIPPAPWAARSTGVQPSCARAAHPHRALRGPASGVGWHISTSHCRDNCTHIGWMMSNAPRSRD